MKNREALERLYLGLDDHPTLTKCYDTLFKDLDRLEKLEKAIEILKGRICVHNQYICYDAYADIRLKDNEIELLEEVFDNGI